jgi:hypothetical protein
MADEKEKEQEPAKTAKEIYGEELPKEVVQSGIGVGFVSETDEGGAAAGVQPEEDRAKAQEDKAKEGSN